jgi:hypothetical protein
LDYSALGDAYHEVVVYCSYWIENNTNIPLMIRTDTNDTEAAGSFNNEKILMFDYNNKNIVFSNKVRVVVDETKSEAFSIDNVKNSGEIQISGKNLGLYVDIGSARYKRTKVVTITPRYVTVNHTGKPISIKPFKSEQQVCIFCIMINHYRLILLLMVHLRSIPVNPCVLHCKDSNGHHHLKLIY